MKAVKKGKLVVTDKNDDIVLTKEVSDNFYKFIDKERNLNLKTQFHGDHLDKDIEAYTELMKLTKEKNGYSPMNVRNKIIANPSMFMKKEENLLNRLKVLLGSYHAGNAKNKSLQTELMFLIDKLLEMKSIDQNTHKQIFNEYLKK
jgi:hypothetical protein